MADPRYPAFLQMLLSNTVSLGPCDSSGPYFETCERCGQSLRIASCRNLITGLAKGKRKTRIQVRCACEYRIRIYRLTKAQRGVLVWLWENFTAGEISTNNTRRRFRSLHWRSPLI